METEERAFPMNRRVSCVFSFFLAAFECTPEVRIRASE